ncbi:hypothetical protein BX600DRAFT_510617 [Xylariales sp. PMI_506]|nr:hypothetical protein BX600DRAFT_510617 [Xylariales sp. PMI_506]
MSLRCANAPSTARVFLQLSARPRESSSILDVLLPPPRLQARSFRSFTRVTAPAIQQQQQKPRSRALPFHPAVANTPVGRGAGAGAPSRAFSTTSPQRRTEAIHNPQFDEEGNDMMLEFTPRAASRLSKIMEKDKNPNLALRIQVESGGCHGFQYVFSLPTLPTSISASAPAAAAPSPAVESEVTPSTTTTAAPTSSSSEIREDDTIFAFIQDEPGKQELSMQPKIIIDSPSLELLKGSKLDYTMELIGSQFKIVDNPAATSSCGCGTSFDIKF